MKERNIEAFHKDAGEGGYVYTRGKLSSTMANQRLSQATQFVYDFAGKRVIDIGCGDGTYTMELIKDAKAAYVMGIEPAENAVARARATAEQLKLNAEFSQESAYELPFQDNEFDVAHVRGVLHHLDNAEKAVHEALRVAKAVVIIEPNGYSPILKVLEKVSPYHRDHDEKSYPATLIDKWITAAGATKDKACYAGLVPMFCPDWMARVCKTLEPVVEHFPLVNRVGCAVYVVSASKQGV